MHTWMNGWDWAWMSLMMTFWIVLVGVAVYVAVRLAHRPPSKVVGRSTHGD